SRIAVASADGARRRRYLDARPQAGCVRDGALRRRRPHRRPHGPCRRSRRGAGDPAAAQAQDHVRHVRNGGRGREPGGGTVSNGIGLVIEGMVAILLVLTIGYCIVLNSRLKMLKADEQALKATISELITATEIAERAIAGLKLTVRDCDLSLGERLRYGEELSGEISGQLDDGKAVLERLSRIVQAARPAVPSQTVGAIGPDVQAIAEAAQAFAARARMRPPGVAA